uniref:Uncharacterized protein n=1 Tax=Phlebotomus papatasi TaxID=29031 RepID=A0A1B0DI59_PHLPP
MIKFIVILALVAVSVQAYPAEEEPAAPVEVHPREVPKESDVAAVAAEEEANEGLNPSESAWGGWGYGGWGGGWGGGWRRGWGGWGGWRGYGGWGGRGYGW